MRFSVVGFLVGALCALVLFIVCNALLTFEHSTLLFGLAALVLWAFVTANWSGGAFITRR